MPLTLSPTELTTALTDALLALECMVVLLGLRFAVPVEPGRTRLWCGIFGLLALASALGAAAHGLRLPPAWVDALWVPLYLSLGILLALVLVAALHDWRGPAVAARFAPFGVAAGVVFYGITEVFDGAFWVFVVYEAQVMLAALAIYLFLAVTHQRRGAGVVGGGIALTLLAAGLQASTLAVTSPLPLDHNGLFHLVQMLATAVLGVGVARGMQ